MSRSKLVALFVFAFALTSGCGGSGESVQVQFADVQLPASGQPVAEYAVCADGSNVYVVWTDTSGDVLFNSSDDRGDNWLASNLVLAAGADATYPRICCSGRVVHVAWEKAVGANRDIAYRRTIDGGLTFDPEVRLDVGDNPGEYESRGLQLTCSTFHVFAAWEEDRAGIEQVFVNYSSDRGRNWLPSAENAVRSSPGQSRVSTVPSLACEGDTLYVAWLADGERIYMNSLQAGGSWSDELRVDHNTGGTTLAPKIAVDGGTAHIVWAHDIGAFAIEYNATSDRGTSWLHPTTDARIDTDDLGAAASDIPQIVVVGLDVYVVWHDKRLGDTVFFNRSLDGGQTWGDPETLVSDDVKANVPWIAASPWGVFVAWENRELTKADTFLDVSLDRGGTFLAQDIQLNSGVAGSADSRAPRVAVTDQIGYAIWRDDRSGTYQLYIRRSVVN